MNVISMKPVPLCEALDIIKDSEEKKPLHDYLKSFSKITKEKAEKMTEELKDMKNVKINEDNIIKLIDFMPRDAEEVHKVCNNVSLDEKEVNDILAVVGKY